MSGLITYKKIIRLIEQSTILINVYLNIIIFYYLLNTTIINNTQQVKFFCTLKKLYFESSKKSIGFTTCVCFFLLL